MPWPCTAVPASERVRPANTAPGSVTGLPGDLAARVIRTPGAPENSFGDDPLRMLRAARFVAQLGLTPAPRVLDAIGDMAGELARITRERVQTELTKLICGRFPRRGIELLTDMVAPLALKWATTQPSGRRSIHRSGSLLSSR